MPLFRPAFPLTRQRPAFLPVLLLALALLWAQLLGQAHRVLHAPLARAATTVLHSPGGTGHDHGHDLLSHLQSSGSDAGSDCRLYDQLGQADALSAVPALALAQAAPAWFCRAMRPRLRPAAGSPFEARAPPAVR